MIDKEITQKIIGKHRECLKINLPKEIETRMAGYNPSSFLAGLDYGLEFAYEIVGNQPKVGEWIPCSEGLPEEHDTMFKKFKGTNKWNDAMFETFSNKVNVTIEFENGKRLTDTSHTTDGKWMCEKEYGLGTKVIAWQPLPEPYRGEEHGADN